MELYTGRPESTQGRLPREIRTYDFLDRLGIAYQRTDHERADSMEACNVIDAVLGVIICKNLFLCNRQKTSFYLLIMPGEKPFKTKLLSKQIGSARLSFASPEHMEKYLDITPGSVSTHTFIGGGEESFGYMAYDKVRDKCSPSAICLICEIAAYAKDNGMTLYEYLMNIYMEYGFQRETTINVVRPGKTGAEEIAQMMVNYRTNPVTEIAGEKVIRTKDFQQLVERNLVNGKWEEKPIVMALGAKSNVLQYFTEGGLKVSVRPSGTEPKIKFYFEIPAEMKTPADYEAATAAAEARVPAIKASLGL